MCWIWGREGPWGPFAGPLLMPKLTAQLKRGAPIPAGSSEGLDCSKLGFFFFFHLSFSQVILGCCLWAEKSDLKKVTIPLRWLQFKYPRKVFVCFTC